MQHSLEITVLRSREDASEDDVQPAWVSGRCAQIAVLFAAIKIAAIRTNCDMALFRLVLNRSMRQRRSSVGT